MAGKNTFIWVPVYNSSGLSNKKLLKFYTKKDSNLIKMEKNYIPK